MQTETGILQNPEKMGVYKLLAGNEQRKNRPFQREEMARKGCSVT
ncbi:hypothetical protein STZ1_30784 [Bacillus subtilis]